MTQKSHPSGLLFINYFITDIIKKKFSSYVGNGIQKSSKDVVTFSPQTGQRHIVLEPKIRTLKTSITQEVKTKIQMTSLRDAALKDALRRQEHVQSQRDRSRCSKEENSQEREKESENSLKGTDPKDVPVPWHDQEVSTNKTEDSRVSSPDRESGSASADEARSKPANRKPHGDPGAQSLLSSVEDPGSFKGEYTKPAFPELFAKAKNAHYLRHRVPPESERLLSIREIFGHSDPSLPRVGKEL